MTARGEPDPTQRPDRALRLERPTTFDRAEALDRADRPADPTPRARHVEWGDFQTPTALAREVVDVLARAGVDPRSVVEPTCGRGEFLAAVLERFSGVRAALGVEIWGPHAAAARERLEPFRANRDVEVRHADVFAQDWTAILTSMPQPILLIGNPPWVTNAAIGRAAGANLPRKHNGDALPGVAARTGAANFDLSESVLRTLLAAARGRDVQFAFLCKSAVARKVLAHAWRERLPIEDACLHAIDARRWFGAAVDAGLLRMRIASQPRRPEPTSDRCARADSLAHDDGPAFAWRDGRLVSDADAYERWRALDGASPLPWRSGVKHDAARVLELVVRDGALWNGFGARVDVEDDCVHPLRKAADLALETAPERRILLPQRATGDATDDLASRAPRTAAYLEAHAEHFARRKSSIYRGRARFALFGIGPYSFAPWKVAISGLRKRLEFVLVGPVDGRPCQLDDTTYFVACSDEAHARSVLALLSSAPAREFLAAHVFLDAKRPITAATLNRLDLSAVERELSHPVDVSARS